MEHTVRRTQKSFKTQIMEALSPPPWLRQRVPSSFPGLRGLKSIQGSSPGQAATILPINCFEMPPLCQGWKCHSWGTCEKNSLVFLGQALPWSRAGGAAGGSGQLWSWDGQHRAPGVVQAGMPLNIQGTEVWRAGDELDLLGAKGGEQQFRFQPQLVPHSFRGKKNPKRGCEA